MTFQYTLNTSLKKIDVTANSKPYFPFWIGYPYPTWSCWIITPQCLCSNNCSKATKGKSRHRSQKRRSSKTSCKDTCCSSSNDAVRINSFTVVVACSIKTLDYSLKKLIEECHYKWILHLYPRNDRHFLQTQLQ